MLTNQTLCDHVQAGFLSAGKKDSMFSVPDNPDAKVGVIGSGQGMTDYKHAGRHEFSNI